MDLISDELELEDRLTSPSSRDIEAASRLHGDVLILGAGGKMGPSLAVRMARAIQAAGLKHKLIAVVRKDRGWILRGSSSGVRVIETELLDHGAVDGLPDALNVVFMVGRKFGSESDLPLTWATNVWIAGLVAQRFRQSRIVAFSTGNVYPLVSADGRGANEQTPPGPRGEYAQSALGRERIFEYFSKTQGTPVLIYRLNYAVDLRYGVLNDICEKVLRDEPIDLTTGFVNVIWQGDANSYCLRAFSLCASPPRILNVTGARTLSVREVAQRFGELVGKTPVFTEKESSSALLSDASRCAELLGPTEVSEDELINLTAHWLRKGGVTLGKPTKFEVRDGAF